MVKGYSLSEIVNYGFSEWTQVARKSVSVDFGCEYYEDCPCCNCDATVTAVVTYSRPRWSKSGKRMVEDTESRYLCSSHN